MKHPILTLFEDPLNSWGITREHIKQEFNSLVQSKSIKFLGWRSKNNIFNTDTTLLKHIDETINLYSYYDKDVDEDNKGFFNSFIDRPMTHDIVVINTHSSTINLLKDKIANLLSTHRDNVFVCFVQSNVTIFLHRDNGYIKKLTTIHENFKPIIENMVTDVALNWSIVGQESIFRVKEGSSLYTNEKDTNALMFFDPCKYLHGTTLNIPRLTMTVRVKNINFIDAYKMLETRLTMIGN